MSAYKLKIPEYGTLNGTAKDGIAEFKNVKFGHIDKRFTPAKLYAPLNPDTQEFDCTRQGPICPQIAPYNDNHNGVPLDECSPLDIRFSESDCLNLWLQIPLGYKNLPVVVWLHGGSNVAGTPYRGSSRAFSWLHKAIELGKPFIFIAPHYRVGTFGFMPWNDGKQYNHAIDDQRLAIEWVRKYGPAFGADINKITFGGQSAGASDLYAHVLDKRTTSLVSQFALLSGHIGKYAFVSRELYADLAERLAKEIGCSVGELQHCDAEQIVAAQEKHGVEVLAAVSPDPSLLPKMSEMPRLIVGDCERDAHFFDSYAPAENLTPEGRYTVEFLSETIFWRGANELWEKYPVVFRQLLDAPNPYTPSMGNNHMVELHYILNGYNLANPVIAATQEVWVQLVNLESPWDHKTTALWIPPEGLPRLISNEEARSMRPIKSVDLDPTEIIQTLRGW